LFVASERDPDLDAAANPTIEFSVKANGEISLNDPWALGSLKTLSGKRIKEYKGHLESFALEAPLVPTISGEWEGVMKSVAGDSWNVRLVVTPIGGATLGRMTFSGGGTQLDFQMGAEGKGGVLYLTTGKLETSWIHIRAVRNGDYLEGQYIAGALGVLVPNFKLKKVR
jgi:hypothetical protein